MILTCPQSQSSPFRDDNNLVKASKFSPAD